MALSERGDEMTTHVARRHLLLLQVCVCLLPRRVVNLNVARRTKDLQWRAEAGRGVMGQGGG